MLSKKRKRFTNGGQLKRRRSTAATYYSGMGEMKFHDVDVDDAVIAVNGVIHNTGSINLIVQGITESTRIGRKCTITAIQWRWSLDYFETTAQATATNAEQIRMILYLDRQANGATAAITDILESNSWLSYYNLANSSRFRILMDRTYVFQAQAGAGITATSEWAGNEKAGKFYKKCNIPLEFSAALGALTELRSNNLAIMTVSKRGDLVGLTSKIRLRFSDH